jgi:hypothetical protein
VSDQVSHPYETTEFGKPKLVNKIGAPDRRFALPGILAVQVEREIQKIGKRWHGALPLHSWFDEICQ